MLRGRWVAGRARYGGSVVEYAEIGADRGEREFENFASACDAVMRAP